MFNEDCRWEWPATIEGKVRNNSYELTHDIIATHRCLPFMTSGDPKKLVNCPELQHAKPKLVKPHRK